MPSHSPAPGQRPPTRQDTESQLGAFVGTGQFAEDLATLLKRNDAEPVRVVPLIEPAAGDIVTTSTKIAAGPVRLVHLLEGSSGEQSVRVAHWPVDSASMRALLAACVACPQVTALRFWGARLGADSLAQLAAVLPQTRVTSLAIDANGGDVGELSGPALAALVPSTTALADSDLEEPSSLQELSLRSNGLDDACVETLARALENNTSLLMLNLWHNSIGDAGAAALAHVLRLNRSLQWLSLGRNAISDAGARALAEVMRRFRLTHEEIVLRRKLLFTGSVDDAAAGSARFDRPTSSKGGSAAKGKTLKPASSKKERVPSAKGKTPAKSNTGGKTPAKRGGKGAGSGDAGGAVGGWASPPQQQKELAPPP